MTDFASAATVAPEQWREWTGRNVAVTDEGLRLASRPAVDPTDLGVSAVDVSAADAGTVYALNRDGEVRRYDPGTTQTGVAWAAETAERSSDPRALVVAGDRIYLADAGSGDLLVVSGRHRSVDDRIPADLANPVTVLRHDRVLYVLDRGDEPDGDDDGGGPGGRLLAVTAPDEVRTVRADLVAPTDLAIGPEGVAYVLDRADGLPVVRTFDLDPTGESDAVDGTTIDPPADPDTGDAVEPTCLAAGEAGTLLLGGTAGFEERGGLYRLEVTDGAVHSVERLPGFDRHPERLRRPPRGARSERRSYYAVADGEVVGLAATLRNRRHPDDGGYAGTAFRRIDAGTPGIEWHRVALSFETPPANARVVVRYYADDGDQPLATVDSIEGVDAEAATALREHGVAGAWDLLEREPSAIARMVGDEDTDRAEAWRGAALDLVEAGPEKGWKTVRAPNPTDALLEAAEGRYLHLGIDVVGDARESPLIGSVRAYCPRKSYLRYLPELFGSDGGEPDFFEEFLAVFESAYVDVEEDIESITRLLDARGTPRESLDWLAGWLALDLPEGWPEPARRELIARAPELFRQRGTERGLRSMLGIYLDHVAAPDVDWMARWRTERVGARETAGALSSTEADQHRERIRDQERASDRDHLLWVLESPDLDGIDGPGARPYARYMRGNRSFVVFAGPFVRRRHRRAVARVVERERPAHTGGAVVETGQDCKLDGTTFLGVNSTLVPRRFELGRATLGGDTVLGEHEPFP